ncbi:MAG: redoxin domain-containing protein [Planctomyces sp.]|nr:redoxin domain-containing protein [Planctomyces sp.]
MSGSIAGLTSLVLIAAATSQAAPAEVTPAQILAFKPRRAGVQIETPKEADLKQCRVESENRGKASGWVLFGPQGQVLRRFLDTNGDGEVNEYRYFNLGIEVYREVDTNGNKKADQYRYLGTAGTRVGVDSNEDGRIDSWAVLSAEEATLEAVRAMAANDPVALQTVLLTKDDVRKLGVSERIGERLLANVQDPAGSMRTALANSKTIQSSTVWERFDCSMRLPTLLAVSPGKWDQDVFVYENVMAMVMNGDTPGFVQIGELVRVGDVWKLTRIPQPMEGTDLQLEGGILMQESLDSGSLAPAEGLSPEGQRLVEQLKQLDDRAPGPDADLKAVETYNLQRADLVLKIARTVQSESDKDLWWKQLIEGVMGETQRGAFPNGIDRLREYEKELQDARMTSLVPFLQFRMLLAEFADKMQNSTSAEHQKIQEQHLQNLRDFVQRNPKSEDAPEAMWQVSTIIEFNGNLADAEKWYAALAKEYPNSPAGKRATGAITRLGLKGKDLNLSGPALGGNGTVDVAKLRGKVVAVVFWATWFRPSIDETPQLAELYRTHQPQGFEIVGVNLDPAEVPVADFLRQQRATWPQIQEAGGMDSGELSIRYGLIAPGTMFLVGKDGKVISNSASIDDLKKLVPNLVKQ